MKKVQKEGEVGDRSSCNVGGCWITQGFEVKRRGGRIIGSSEIGCKEAERGRTAADEVGHGKDLVDWRMDLGKLEPVTETWACDCDTWLMLGRGCRSCLVLGHLVNCPFLTNVWRRMKSMALPAVQ